MARHALPVPVPCPPWLRPDFDILVRLIFGCSHTRRQLEQISPSSDRFITMGYHILSQTRILKGWMVVEDAMRLLGLGGECLREKRV